MQSPGQRPERGRGAFEPLRLTVLTPAETLLDAQGVLQVQARLADGAGIGIYPGHAPLLAETDSAPLAYVDAAGEHRLDLEAGVLRIERGRVTVFTSGLARSAPAAPDLAPGLHEEAAEAERAAEQAEEAEEVHFDRLARELLVALQAAPQGVLALDEDEPGGPNTGVEAWNEEE